MRYGRWMLLTHGGDDSFDGPVGIGGSKEREGSGGFIRGEVGDHEENLRLAEERGIRPISFSDLQRRLKQRGLGGPENWILFDTAPESYGTPPGNHWRVLAVDNEIGAVMLQPCIGGGTWDLNLEVEVVQPDEAHFTGIAVVDIRDNQGRQFSVAEVARLG